MKQYNQNDLNRVASIVPEKTDRDIEKLEVPQVEAPKEVELTNDQLHDALMYAQDILERAMVPFLVFGETAEAIHSLDMPLMFGKGIHLGVRKQHLTESGKSIISMLATDSIIDDRFVMFEYKGVPITIDVIKNDYPFLNNPDVKFYHLTEFKLPNPYNEYVKWKDQLI